MSEQVDFPGIDTSYWKMHDKVWIAERKEQWLAIEPMFQYGASKTKRAVGIIKQYFLKGKLPDFKALRSWHPYFGHLDLFNFIWLHPSWDETVLLPLRDAYIAHKYIKDDDVLNGFGLMNSCCLVRPCCKYTQEESLIILRTDHNQVMFKVMMADLQQTEYLVDGAIRQLPKSKLFHLTLMSEWLCLENMYAYNEDMVFQYDLALEWWYQSCPENEDFFERKKVQYTDCISDLYRYLYRIHHFDTEKEGDTCRTRFVHKMKNILDEREFISEFKQMWLDVKADRVDIEEPWNIHWKPKPKKPRLP
jgi:hypothetical protein